VNTLSRLPEAESKRQFFDSVVTDGVHDGIMSLALAPTGRPCRIGI
jgi:hypothetical protein